MNIIKKTKGKSSISKSDKLQILAMHVFFLFLICIVLALFIYETASLKKTVAIRLQSDSRLTASDVSSAIKTQIDAHFHDLKFLRTDFLNINDGHLTPNAQALHVFKDFKKYHPGIAAINILNPSMDKIIWSSYPKNLSLNIKKLFLLLYTAIQTVI